MAKKIYIPSYDELYEMQDMGVNIYNYLLVKVIELLVLEGVKYPKKGMLKTAYKYIQEDPYISYSICRMYPHEIQYSNIASNDVKLCNELITKENDTSIYNFDNLVYFNNNVIKTRQVIENTIALLSYKLLKTPQYRFEYKEGYIKDSGTYNCNQLLYDIFGRKIDLNQISNSNILRNLMDIEPAYALSKDIEFDSSYLIESREEALKYRVGNYIMRYGLSDRDNREYMGKDILTKPDEKTKRLIRCINLNKENIY